MTLTLGQLAAQLNLHFSGDAQLEISGLASLESAIAGNLCFIQQPKYLSALLRSDCSAAIVPLNLAMPGIDKAVIFAKNPQYSFSRAIDLLNPAGSHQNGPLIHPSAQVSDRAEIGNNVSIGALAVVSDEAGIADNCIIGAGCIIENGAHIGADCVLHSNVMVGHHVVIGNRCIFHSGVVLGADGFGLVMHQDRWHKVPQIGSVRIDDDVEIGANTTVDRGALDNTVIETGCKLDNLIQVAHNVRIGAHTAIAACVGIAGSAIIGKYCKISGAAVVLGHLSIADHVTITAMSLVTKSIKHAGVYSSGTPLLENKLWHRNNARYKSLDKLAKSVANLEKGHKRID